MVQGVSGSNPYYGYAPPPAAGGPQASGNVQGGQNPYQSDTYAGGNYYMANTSMAASGSISAIVSDPKAASRFSLFLINTPDRLLTVGAGLGSVGRGFLNLLAGNVPLFTSSAQSAEISNNVRLWMSSADLMRTGANANHAVLLQDIGVWKAQDLAVYYNPSDQAVLSQRMAGAAAARGITDIPTPAMIGGFVQAANQVNHYNY